MKRNSKSVGSHIMAITLIVLLVLFSASIIFFGILFGTVGFFYISNSSYESIWSVCLFILLLSFVSGFLELFEYLLKIIITGISAQHKVTVLLKYGVELLFLYGSLSIVDDWMESISLSSYSKLFFAILLLIIGNIDSLQKKKHKNK
ncbi:YrvL family regulatory protein [Priestia endophytica]|nr:YrvL family regulatory protein [Priestia endophytica]